MTDFKDHYSDFAKTYAKGRLQYPPELFRFLASLTQEHLLAWDCGTGNGQAALGLTGYYDRIIATDPSNNQIGNCTPHSKIEFRVEAAEKPSLAPASVDLLTVGIALHWFHFDAFYPTAKQILKKNGVFAAWAYFLPDITPEIDELLRSFTETTLGEFWKPEIRLIHEEYKTIPFPFKEIEAPRFTIEKEMSLKQFEEHMYTWSAVQFYMQKKNADPVKMILNELTGLWGEGSARQLSWKMPLRVGRNS
jgi:ubiquinone/menaquinone biosynthesis C-methylase UbiE